MEGLDKFKTENPEKGARLEDFMKSNPNEFDMLSKIGLSLDQISKSGESGDIEGYISKAKKEDDEGKKDEYSDDEYKADCESVDKMKADISKMEEKMSAYKGKKEKSEKGADLFKAEDIEKSEIFKSIRQENSELRAQQGELMKSMGKVLDVVDDLKEAVDKMGSEPIQKSIDDPSFLEKANTLGFDSNEETGVISMSVTKQKGAVQDMIQTAIEKAEDSEAIHLRESQINYTAGAGAVPSQKTANYLLLKHKVKLVD